MKIRTDYVSNSSSCSFIVSSPKEAVKMFIKSFGKSVDWPYQTNDISVELTGSKDALQKVKDVVECGRLDKSFNGVDEYELFDLTLEAVMGIPMKLWKGITQMSVSAEDTNDSNVMLVRLLRAFFDKNGIETEDSGDVHSSLDGDGIMLKLMHEVASVEIKQQETMR